MKIFTTKKEIEGYFANKDGKVVGMVDTMGALNTGHISLIKQEQKKSNEVI